MQIFKQVYQSFLKDKLELNGDELVGNDLGVIKFYHEIYNSYVYVYFIQGFLDGEPTVTANLEGISVEFTEESIIRIYHQNLFTKSKEAIDTIIKARSYVDDINHDFFKAIKFAKESIIGLVIVSTSNTKGADKNDYTSFESADIENYTINGHSYKDDLEQYQNDII